MSLPTGLLRVRTAIPAVRTRARGYFAHLTKDPARLQWTLRVALPVLSINLVAGVLRLWDLSRIGFNSDEAVYAGTAASIAGDPNLGAMFPIFRAHPVLLQMIISIFFQSGVSDWAARAVCAVVGILAVSVTYALGRRLYGHTAGVLGALILAVMPYHVTVSRQVLLDGLMTLCATVVLYCLVRYAEGIVLWWLLAAGAMMGVTVLAKETSLVLLGGVYAFFALTPVVRLRGRHLLLALATFGCVAIVMPVVLSASGRASTGQNYLLWQLVRRPNHELLFYPKVVPPALGWLVVVAAVAGLLWLRRENTWRERLLLSWITVPIVFFTLWPVKGYQYLLPIAPVVAILAGRSLARSGELVDPIRSATVKAVAAVQPWLRQFARAVGTPLWTGKPRAMVTGWIGRYRAPQWWRAVSTPAGVRRGLVVGLSVAVLASLAVPAWRQVGATGGGTFLAGSGGLPAGRETGTWIGAHVPEGARLLAIGPSMANVLQFYGKRRVLALSVSSNPMERNPSYVPVPNPDRAMRDGEFQYVVWDTYTATRSPFFASKLAALVDKYHGIAVYTATVSVRADSGAVVVVPAVIVYQVRA